jgi:hypothetical protein
MLRVSRSEGRAIIEGMERLRWGEGRDNTFMGALTVVAHALGDDPSYDFLMGVSGAAFRLQLCQPEWCPSAPDAGCGYQCDAAAAAALGYATEAMFASADDGDQVRRVREAVIHSIGQGYPVIALDLVKSADYGVIVGYDDAGEAFLCRTYWDETDEYARGEKWPWVTVFVRERSEPPARAELVRRSLQQAVMLASTERFDNYLSGFAAYEAWAEQLLEEPRFAPDGLQQTAQANAWSYLSLMDCRAAACRYLRTIAEEFPAARAQRLLKAADVYERIVDVLGGMHGMAPFPGQLAEGRYPLEHRQAEAETLREALALERQAVLEIEQALAIVH